MARLKGLMAIIIGVALFAGFVFSATAEEFYKGKTITFAVGFSPGGGFDTYTRMIARHFGKHVPGKPTTVVQNRTGAGSLVAANYIYNKAKRDGTVIGNWIGPLVLQHVMGNKSARFDGRKFGWLGVPTPDSGICAFTKASGITSLDKWFASKRPVKIGGIGPGSTTDDPPKLLKVAIGLPLKVIEGYKGTAKVRLAAESGEVDGACFAWQSVKTTWRRGIESGNVVVVLQTMLKSHPELKNVPLAINYAKTAEARELLKVASGPYGSIVRPYSVPPGTPKDRLRLLQKAFMDTMRDPELLKEAKKAKLEFDPIDGSATRKLITKLYDIEPALLARLKEILLPKKK